MKKYHIILLHLAFWFVYAVAPIFPSFFRDKEFPEYYYQFFAIRTALYFINFYVCYLFIPELLKLRKLLIYSITAVFILIFTFFRLGVVEFFQFLFETDIPHHSHTFESKLISSIGAVLIFTGFAFFIRFTIDWFTNQRLRAELVAQNKESELALLRLQVNPHFLFNTLNNIYSLVSRQSEQAPQAVLTLSEIMRYMLYEANTETVNLAKEVEYLENFIKLQMLRIKDKQFVEFKKTGNFDTWNISPMLLIPFVENAFKHGDKKTPPPGIIIDLSADHEKMIFKVSNFKKKNDTCKDNVGGIGLNNVKRRLELLYQGKYNLNIQTTTDKYQTELSLYK